MILRRASAAALAALLLVGLFPVQAFAANPPVAQDVSVSGNEDTAKVITVTAQDAVDNDAIDSFQVDTGPTHGTLGAFSTPDCTTPPACTATVTYTPNANYAGDDSFTFTATDTAVETSAPATANITVVSVNDAPSFTKGPDQTVNEDSGAASVSGWATAISPGGGADEAGQNLTFEMTGDTNASLFAVEPAVDSTGKLTFTPADDANGNATITLHLKDDGGGSDTSNSPTFVITVQPVDDVPSFSAGADQVVSEDSGAHSVVGWASDIVTGPANESGQAISFIVAASDPSLFSAGPAVSSTGTLTFTPAANKNGLTTVSVRVHDDGGIAHGGSDTSAPQVFTVAINQVNDAPTANDDSVTVLEDAATTPVDVLGNDSIAPDTGETLTVTGVGVAGHGVAAVSGDDLSATYTPNANVNGTDTFTYSISDGNGGTAGATVHVTITAVNDAPSFTKGADQTVNEDSGAHSATGWATGMQPGGGADESTQTFTFVADSDSNAALFSVLPAVSPTGTLTFTPAANAYGSATITLHVKDSGGVLGGGDDTSPTQSFTITVNPVNDAPTFTKGLDQSIGEDAAAQSVSNWATAISAGPANENTQSVSFVVSGNTNSGLFAVAPAVSALGTLTYTPAANANGSATITLHAVDDGGTANGGDDTSNNQTFVINVANVNDAPSFTKGSDPSVNEDAGIQTLPGWATSISAGASNESGQALNFVIDTDSDAGLFSVAPAVSAAGTLTFTPALNANGTALITLHLHDNGGTAGGGDDTSPTQSFTITVQSVNDAPSFTKGANQTDLEDAGLQTVPGWATSILRGGGADEAGQLLTFVVDDVSNASLFAISPAVSAGGTLTYTLAPDANGIATITLHLEDNGGAANGGDFTSASQTFSITVTAVNDAPSFTKGANEAISEDAGLQSVPDWATAIDAGAPNESSQVLTFVVDSTTNASLFSVAPSISPTTGTLTYTPAANANGTSTVTIHLADNGGVLNGGDSTSPTVTFTISVAAVNDPPTFTQGADPVVNEGALAQTQAGWATAIFEGATNESAQTMAFSVTGDSDPGLFSVAPAIGPTGTLTWTPAPDANGTASIDVVLVDNGGGTDTSITHTFTITVNAVNDAPSFTKGADALIFEDAGLQSVPGWATDLSKGPANESGQALTFETTSNTNPGLFAVAPTVAPDGTLSYTAAADANGVATIGVKVTDDGGIALGGVDSSAVQTFTITVTAVNDAPTFTSGGDVGAAEGAGLQTVAGWATLLSPGPGEAGQVLTFTVTGNDDPTLFAVQPAISSTGTLTFTPAAHRNGVATISVHLSDNGGTANGGSDTGSTVTFTITVSGVDDPPIAGNDLAPLKLTGATAINVLANDSGGPGETGDIPRITSVHEGGRGIVTITGGGTGLTYDPIGCSTGTDTFTYTIADGAGVLGTPGHTATATVLVTISSPAAYPVADGPNVGFSTGSTIATTIPVKIAWCSLVSGTTVSAYTLAQSTNSGAYSTIISSTTATSTTRSLGAAGTTYQFRAKVTDKKGHVAYGAGPRLRVIRTQQDSSAVTYSTPWVKTTNSNHSGGSAVYTSTAGRTATFTYTGRAFAIVGPRLTTGGSFYVDVDGVRVTPTAISEKASKTSYRLVLYTRSLGWGTHTVKITTASSSRVYLDAFLSIATP